jgi:hypothetical protein
LIERIDPFELIDRIDPCDRRERVELPASVTPSSWRTVPGDATEWGLDQLPLEARAVKWTRAGAG